MKRRNQDHSEVELKFDLGKRAARKVRRHALLARADHDVSDQRTVYFDTGKGEVHKAGFSLRVRQSGDDFTQTVKTGAGSAGLFDRGEWEAPVDQLAPDLKELERTPLSDLKKLRGRLEPTVSSDVERGTWLIDHDGSVIEVVLDSGTVSAGGEEASFHELELELRDGEPRAMFDLAQQLGQAAPLEIGVLSKEERGLLLAKGALGTAQKASALDIDRNMNVAQAFMAVVHECVRHFRLNERLIIEKRDPEALHQARVAMRRLRTAFSLFRPAIRQGSLEPLRNELRAFIEPFGEARNLDVFLDGHGDEVARRDRRKLKSARADAYDQVIDALNAQRTRDMFLDLVEWTATGNWQKGVASAPIEKFAAKRLGAIWRKVDRRGSKLGDLEEKQLHRLRIDIKKLRYAVEFLAPLYGKKEVRKFASSLEDMQDCLGLVHDDMVSRQIVDDYALRMAGRTDAAGRSRQLKTAARRFKRLNRAGQFWAS